MNFLELTKKRCSVRKYASRPVETEKLDYILEAARMAPSAVNYQPWCFLVVKSDKGREKIQSCYPREWFKQAPCYIVVCGDRGDRGGAYLPGGGRAGLGFLLGLQF